MEAPHQAAQERAGSSSAGHTQFFGKKAKARSPSLTFCFKRFYSVAEAPVLRGMDAQHQAVRQELGRADTGREERVPAFGISAKKLCPPLAFCLKQPSTDTV